MRKLTKKLVSMMLVTIFILITTVQVFGATGSYSRPLPTLNILGGRSMEVTVSAPSLPRNAKITKVTMTGSRSGYGTVIWNVKHNGTFRDDTGYYSTRGTNLTGFYNLEADTTWTIFVSSQTDWTTITNGYIKVEYTY